ncbi:MAG: type II toxin-antitoxin system Phd/YefM family antitoxin [Deltaproteobacteria bacterium]|nr:type II toxin-antitoxin system Phd/YefM family antitoxin [Deltaproteobacteria bacterium]MBW2078692.1 type II toxin-antitoxin system Phd/YefM family antitoxin [Deltaproteobacteria bacterium]MBW2312459.1 type II toxin-antitoxin system Phd/YefM family antitoxin [Deltaproteobacteria bacterium]
METIGVKELRDNLSRILKKVASGEVIRVLRHGRDMVELRPLVKNSEQELLSRLKEKNLLEGRGIRVIGSIKTVKNLKPEAPVSDLIAEDRR